MKSWLAPKLIAASVLGLLFAGYVRHDRERWILRGREAFIAYQDRRFSGYVAHPHFSWSLLITAVLFVILFLAFYELLAWVTAKAFAVTQA